MRKGLARFCTASVSDMAQRRERTASNSRQQYDTVSKILIHQNPEDWLQFSLGIPEAEVIEVLETEQLTVKSNRADSFIRANVHGKEVIVHLEMQTHDSREVPMPYRMAGYVGRGIDAFQLPIYSHVIYLHPRAGRTDPGEYIQEMVDYEIRIRYKVIRLYDLEGLPFLEAGVKGLIPFTPLMKRPENTEPEEWIRQCVEAADSVPQDDIAKADYLADLAILGGLVFGYPTIRETIMETIMQESSVIQHFLQKGIEQGIEQGIERGTRDSLVEGILENLEVRFNTRSLQAVASTLEYVDDVQRLRQLRREALQTPSLEAFWQTLGLIVTTNGNDSR